MFTIEDEITAMHNANIALFRAKSILLNAAIVEHRVDSSLAEQ